VGSSAGAITGSPAIFNVAPRLSIQPTGHNLALSWPGPFILQSAPAPGGPYADIPAAISPFSQSTTAAPQKFFRLRPPPFVLTPSYSAGAATLQITGPPGNNFIIQASTNLLNWISLQTNTAPCTFVDTAAWQFPARMYRVVPAP